MSYILDALKKAERERKREKVPDMLSLEEGLQRSAAKRPIWHVFVISALSLNAALLLWWFAPWKAGSQKNAAVEPSVRTQQQDTLRPEPLPAAGKEETPSPRIQDEKIHAAKPEQPAAKEPKATIPPKVVSGLVPDRQQDAVIRGRDSGEAGKEERVKEPLPATESAAVLPPAENRIYRVKELPEQLRKALPAFSVSAFLYSATPSSRMVRINGQMLREGEELSPGLQLDEITPDGVIMSCRTYRFRIEVR